jgi:hypothetical protein
VVIVLISAQIPPVRSAGPSLQIRDNDGLYGRDRYKVSQKRVREGFKFGRGSKAAFLGYYLHVGADQAGTSQRRPALSKLARDARHWVTRRTK